MKSILYIVASVLLLSSCAIVMPGEVAVKQRFGKLKPQVHEQGIVGVNPFTTQLIKIPIQTVNKEVRLNLPSKEGLNVEAEISILYHVEKEKVIDIINEVGMDFEKILIISTFRSSAADVCANFYAKDMHSGKRSEIEEQIKDKMMGHLEGRGFVIEAVLMKSIKLPPGLYGAIEAKLKAEQEAQEMEFVLLREEKEAQRKIVEAEGIRDAQKIIEEGLTNEIIKWKSLEVFQELSNSPNSKIIITNGETPMLINE